MRALLAALLVCALTSVAPAQDMSGVDRLAMLYSTRFEFTADGLPILNVMLMENEHRVRLRADGGLVVLPDGEGGAAIRAGNAWTITAENARPARLRFWTVVSREGTEAELARWRADGHEARLFETGLVFGMKGAVIDSRRTFLGVDPRPTAAEATRHAAALAAKHGIDTFTHPEMLKRPEGTIVARLEGADVEVRSPQVVWFAPAAPDGLVTVADVVVGAGGSSDTAKRSTRRYAGRIYVTLGWDGTLTVVNAVPEDRLLRGTVPAEMYPDAPTEALKAQAVAARDELFSRIGTRDFEKPYVTCASQQCQVYGGADSEHPRTNAAVDATRGEVIFRKDAPELVPAYYSAASGGFTESNENIWGTPPDPSLRGRVDARGADARALAVFAKGITDANIDAFLALAPERTFCGRTRYGKGRCRWTVTYTRAELDAMVARVAPGVGRVVALKPLSRGVSGRIKRLSVRGERGETVLEGDLVIRRALGGLKSALFRVQPDGGSWVFDGAGFGHGVGMCQTGAIGMAEGGYKYRDILMHYYLGSEIKRLY